MPNTVVSPAMISTSLPLPALACPIAIDMLPGDPTADDAPVRMSMHPDDPDDARPVDTTMLPLEPVADATAVATLMSPESVVAAPLVRDTAPHPRIGDSTAARCASCVWMLLRGRKCFTESRGCYFLSCVSFMACRLVLRPGLQRGAVSGARVCPFPTVLKWRASHARGCRRSSPAPEKCSVQLVRHLRLHW